MGQALRGLGTGKGRYIQGGPSWTGPGALLSGRLGQVFPEVEGISYFHISSQRSTPTTNPLPLWDVCHIHRCSHTQKNKPHEYLGLRAHVLQHRLAAVFGLLLRKKLGSGLIHTTLSTCLSPLRCEGRRKDPCAYQCVEHLE